MIDKRFIEFKANSYKEEPEELQLAAGPSQTMTDAGPTRIELTGMATPDKTPRVGRAGVPYQAPSMRDITEPAKAMADMGAAAVKGATQGFIGLPGDIEGIGRLILGKMGVNVDEATTLPTTEDVKTWLDKNLGAVGDGKNPYESIGEVAAPGGQIKAAKAVAKGAKALAPTAAKMVMDVTEKTGMPVKGLGIVESGSGDALRATAPASDIGFYSAVEQSALNIKRNSGSGQAMLNEITKGENVKADEIKWLGLDDFLSGKKNVTKQEVQEFIAENKVDVKEVQLGGPVPEDYKKQYNEITDLRDRGGQISNDEWRRRIIKLNTQYGFTPDAGPSDALRTRYDRYTLPGGENYREILLTMPGGFYRSSHFDQPNILAHIRVNDRIDADGKKMLLIEEVQSDWHQAGRTQGYGNQPQYAAEMEGDPAGFLGMKEGVPQAPFKDTWYQLALKRALKYATDNGYERVGLTTGKQQADRFDLSKQVDNISYEPTDKGFYINVISKDGENVLNGDYSVKELEGVVGKEVTQKMIAKEGKNEFDPKVEPDLTEIRRLEGVDLKVGGEGMKKYYDEIYPQFLAKYGKKWNATVGETRIKTGRGVEGGEPVKYIDITPSMKENVGKGQPLFSATGIATGAGAGTMATSQQEPK
jgi:hypothetical protein